MDFESHLVAQAKTDANLGLVLIFLLLVFGLPIWGYVFMVIDIRAYLRKLRGALVIVRQHIPHLPAWAKQYTPQSLRALGLEMPCSPQEVKKAYRKLADQMHPDRGGDRQAFLELQRQFEEAIQFVTDAQTAKPHRRSR